MKPTEGGHRLILSILAHCLGMAYNYSLQLPVLYRDFCSDMSIDSSAIGMKSECMNLTLYTHTQFI